MRKRRIAAGIVSAAISTAGVVLVAPQTLAAGPASCPAAFPTAKAVDGVTGTGYTVERGTTPAPFSATVLGRITDGIAPGVDMIMAELSSTAINKPGVGVWAGMSGSPVYAPDGRLIGSVSYGLAASAPIGGITPAAEMKKLLAAPVAAAQPLGRAKVSVSASVAKRLAATGKVTAAQAAGGFERLAVPVTVSGLSGVSTGHAKAQLDAIGAMIPNSRVMSGGATSAAAGDTPADIIPGGNFVAAVSYGDATLAGTGTTTFVCAGKAVAFGHPFLFTGAAAMSVHPATALFVQPDPVFGSFKVSNPGGVVGRLDSDRLAGIRGILGSAPATTPIVSHVSVVGGGSRTGRTTLVDPRFAARVTFVHVLSNIDRVVDAFGPGTADSTITIKGTRPNGAAFTLVRRDRIGSAFDLSVEVGFRAADLVDRIVNQPFEKVRLTSVTIDASVTPGQNQYRVTSVKVKQGAAFVTPKASISAKAGGTIAVRLGLTPFQAVGPAKTVDLVVPVPAGTAGGFGNLSIAAGPSFSESTATSFTQLLTELRSQPGDDLVRATLTGSDAAGTEFSSATTATVDKPVESFGSDLSVDIS